MKTNELKLAEAKIIRKLVRDGDVEGILNHFRAQIMSFIKTTSLITQEEDALQLVRIKIWSILESGKLKVRGDNKNPVAYLKNTIYNRLKDILRSEKIAKRRRREEIEYCRTNDLIQDDSYQDEKSASEEHLSMWDE